MFGHWSNQSLSTYRVFSHCYILWCSSSYSCVRFCCGWQRKPAKDGEDWAGWVSLGGPSVCCMWEFNALKGGKRWVGVATSYREFTKTFSKVWWENSKLELMQKEESIQAMGKTYQEWMGRGFLISKEEVLQIVDWDSENTTSCVMKDDLNDYCHKVWRIIMGVMITVWWKITWVWELCHL